MIVWLLTLEQILKKKIEDCKKIIEMSQKEEKDLHMAIVNDDDIYMGSVSLKHIDMLINQQSLL